METHAAQAVFLSYASQDSEAARRIAQALREVGIEVWFDESELRGGEAWDASIQRQIAECALFVAIVSGHTQARREGYFRLEWRLADERMRLMAEGTPFLLPVIVDATKERDALVPKSFLGVQWTWLPHGEVPPAWVARVQKLLGGVRPGPAAVASVEKVAVETHGKRNYSGGHWRPKWLGILPWITTFVLGSALIWMGTRQHRSSQQRVASPSQLVTHTLISLPPDAPLATSRLLPLGINYPLLAISPDGTQLVYVASVGSSTQLYRRPLNELGVRPIPDTEGGYYPFFSPDGRSLGFMAKDKLRKVSLLGGSAVTLGDSGSQVLAACWGENGYIYSLSFPKLYRIPDGGGSSTLVEGGEGSLNVKSSEILPGAKWILGSFAYPGVSESGDFRPLSAHSLSTGRLRTVIERGYNPRYLPSGYLVFARGGGLHATAFEAIDAQAVGQPVSMVEGVLSNALDCVAQYTVSGNGILVYAVGGALDRSTPVWVRRDGRVERVPCEPQTYGELRLSPDGRRFAVSIPSARSNIWIFDATTGKGTPLPEPGVNRHPVWISDGRLIFQSWRNERFGVFAKDLAAGDKPATPLLVADEASTVISADTVCADRESALVYVRKGADGAEERAALRLDGSGKLESMNMPVGQMSFIRFSPNGEWYSFTAFRSGRAEVYLRQRSSGQEYQISFDGGEEGTWSAKGDELFFRNRDAWFVATLTFEPVFRAEVREMFKGPFLNVPGYSYDTAPDGQRFLVLMPEHPETPITQLHVITNWTEELKRKVPVGGGKGR
jgi:hypothetical protein